MKNALLVVSLFLSTALHAAAPQGSFKGSSPKLKGPDVMALIVRGDYAVLAEYTRLPYIPGPERIEITKWVPRTYFYKLEPAGENRYALKAMRVSGGALEVDNGHLVASLLTLGKKGRMDGATLTRYDRGSNLASETITFEGKLSSTWEDYVPGKYFGSHDPTGGDYLHKAVNMTLSKDMVAEFTQDEVSGQFSVAEKAPGVFTFTPKGAVKGADKIVTRIGVFIDIVNWKPFFTTDELLLVNPEDPKDVGFYYERH